MALTNKLSAIGDAIRGKTGKSELMTLDEMPDEIESISGGGEEWPETTLTGNLGNYFSYYGRDYMFKTYGDKFKTVDITGLNSCFRWCDATDLSKLVLNIQDSYTDVSTTRYTTDIGSMVEDAHYLKVLPTIGGNYKIYPGHLKTVFRNAFSLRNVDSFLDRIDLLKFRENTSQSNGTFSGCYSLRSVSSNFLKSMYRNNSITNKNYSPYYQLFNYSVSIDEIVDFPVGLPEVSQTVNLFTDTFGRTCRLKRMTFETNNGVPYSRNWTNQNILLTVSVGYADGEYMASYITDYNSGITADKKVSDVATYAALKNDPDWYTTNVNYSRYNHASAVETINSLPDTSAVSDPSAPSNKICFKTGSGSLTDGGGVNALTAEEIAVATNKGWQVVIQ